MFYYQNDQYYCNNIWKLEVSSEAPWFHRYKILKWDGRSKCTQPKKNNWVEDISTPNERIEKESGVRVEYLCQDFLKAVALDS